MSRKIMHIAVIMLAAVTLLPSCGNNDEGKVIPRGKLSRIYAEMLVTDQWITSTPGVRMIADTSLVYAPILEKYGYDLDDYLVSLEVYMDDPERFARILRKSGEMIGSQIEDAERRLTELQRKAMLPKIEGDFKPEEFFPYMFDEPYVHYFDSLTFEPDSLLQIYRLIHIERTDTVFEGVRMKVRTDTLAVADSAKAEPADTVKAAPVGDSGARRPVRPSAGAGRDMKKIKADSSLRKMNRPVTDRK